jgi:hypothetical protein
MGLSLKDIGGSLLKGGAEIFTGGLYKSGLSGGGETASDTGSAASAEQARKDALRRRLDIMFGIDPSAPPGVDQPALVGTTSGRFGKDALMPPLQVDRSGYDSELSQAAQARAQLAGESSRVTDALRGFYTDQLGEQFEEGSRRNKFALARRGLLGGSADVDARRELAEDRDLGATRLDEAVRRAATNLSAQRESERLKATGLIAAGQGESAVTAAQRGLQNAIDNTSNAAKENLFTDLFSVGAAGVGASNDQALQAALLSRYRDQVRSFFPAGSSGSSSGRVTPS